MRNRPWAVNTYNHTLKQISAKAVIHRLSQKSAVINMPAGSISPYISIMIYTNHGGKNCPGALQTP
ncbi:hypothetical protein CBFG_01041 [Clostridiales bacterium 1_7_47FAA]|nr:hypothetical protein CBFG_01041 [Clostridiales bacterium 1_7_47FAA]